MKSVLLHYFSPDSYMYVGSDYIVEENANVAILVNQATLIPPLEKKLWEPGCWPVFDLISQRWDMRQYSCPFPVLTQKENCFYSGRDSGGLVVGLNLNHAKTRNSMFTIADQQHFVELIFPSGYRSIKSNSVGRADLYVRITEINNLISAAWKSWETCHLDFQNPALTFDYNLQVDALLTQIRRVLDEVFTTLYYYLFQKETVSTFYLKIDSFQWLFKYYSKNIEKLKKAPGFSEYTNAGFSMLDLKKKADLLGAIFMGKNICFLNTIVDMYNCTKHSYFSTLCRGRIGDKFPCVMGMKLVEGKKNNIEAERYFILLNVSLNQLIIGANDFLIDVVGRFEGYRSNGYIDTNTTSGYHCDQHIINTYNLDFPGLSVTF